MYGPFDISKATIASVPGSHVRKGKQGEVFEITAKFQNRTEFLVKKVFFEKIMKKERTIDGQTVKIDEFCKRLHEKIQNMDIPTVSYVDTYNADLYMSNFIINTENHLDGADIVSMRAGWLGDLMKFYMRSDLIFKTLGKIHSLGFTIERDEKGDRLHPVLSIFFALIYKLCGTRLLVCDYSNLDEQKGDNLRKFALEDVEVLMKEIDWRKNNDILLGHYMDGKNFRK